MSVELSLADGGTLRVTMRHDALELSTDRRLLRLTRAEAWRLAEALDRLATAADDR